MDLIHKINMKRVFTNLTFTYNILFVLISKNFLVKIKLSLDKPQIINNQITKTKIIRQ